MKEIVDVNSVEKSYGERMLPGRCSLRIRGGEIYGPARVNGAPGRGTGRNGGAGHE